jgi:hypothetical protein
MNKCYICATKKNHHFVDCMGENCNCLCINEIYSMYKNNRQDDIKPVHPKFLKIDNAEIKDLPDLAKEVSEFGRIDKTEWIKVKKDKRFKSKRKR